MASVSTVERIAQSRGHGQPRPCSLRESQNCSQVEPSVREKGGEAWKSPFLSRCPFMMAALKEPIASLERGCLLRYGAMAEHRALC